MILQNIPIGSPWKRGSAMFFLCNSLSVFSIWMVFDMGGISQNFTGWLWLITVAISVILYLAGVFFPVSRLKFAIFILGLFVAMPGFVFCALPFLLFLELTNVELQRRFVYFSLYALLLISWCSYESIKIIRLEKKFDYLRNTIRIKGRVGFFYPNETVDLCNIVEKSPQKLTIRAALSITTPIVFLGYPLQKFISDAGGPVGVFGFLSILTIPMSMYIAGKILSGYFLWIYLAGNFEEKHKINIFVR